MGSEVNGNMDPINSSPTNGDLDTDNSKKQHSNVKVELPVLKDGVNINSIIFEKIISMINEEFLEQRRRIASKRHKNLKGVDLNKDLSLDTLGLEDSFENLLIKNGFFIIRVN
jgi:hypothetical protein